MRHEFPPREAIRRIALIKNMLVILSVLTKIEDVILRGAWRAFSRQAHSKDLRLPFKTPRIAHPIGTEQQSAVAFRSHMVCGTARRLVPLVPWPLVPCLLLTACKPVGPNYNRPGYNAPPAYKESGATTVVVPPPNPQGGAWQPANPSDGMLKGKWWEIYQDPELNRLEERVDTTNVQLRQAMETYLAAQDQVRAVRANLYPTLSAGSSISRYRVSGNRPLAPAGGQTTSGDFVIAGQASWEPDFWGRIRRSIEEAHDCRAGQRRRRGERGSHFAC